MRLNKEPNIALYIVDHLSHPTLQIKLGYIINRVFSIFTLKKSQTLTYTFHLTTIFVTVIISDKYSCHFAKRSCQIGLGKGRANNNLRGRNRFFDEEKYMPLKNSLKVQRVKMGINQAELGNLVGVSRQTISLIERGDYNPSITLVLKLCKVFDVVVEEIFSYQEDKENE